MAALGIMLAALAMQPNAPPPPPDARGDDIVVLARRMRKVRWEFEAKGGVLSRCEIGRTSGSARVDRLVCEASAQCAAERPDLVDSALVPCIRERVARLDAVR